MEFTGTQGEWRVVQLDGSDKRHYRDGFDVAIETDDTSIACVDSDNPHDARLIAAAPDLLEACLGALRIQELWYPVASDDDEECAALNSMRKKFEAAIAKALGE